ncbi:MAG: class I SAM-dependent methyltransferase [Phycisphaerae bacterium]
MPTDALQPRPVPLPRWHRLDPRDALLAATRPLAQCVNIPATELAERAHELPPRDEVVCVSSIDAMAAARAVDWLRASGRAAILAPDATFPGNDAATGAAGEGPVGGRLWEPTAFLVEAVAALPPGDALELACGTGRDAVYLASMGWRVTAVDVLPDALDRGRSLEQRYSRGAPIEWRCADLERGAPPFADRAFDLITAFRFLHRPLFARLAEHLRPAGSIVLETFTTEHRARHGKPARDAFVLAPGELLSLVPGLTVAHFSEAWRGSSHTARLWARA